MNLLLEDTLIQQEPIVSLAKTIYRDREALLQLLLSLCTRKTFNRIEHCPTYPVRAVTPDLEERVQLLRDSIASDSYEISNALAVLCESAVENERRKSFGQYFTPAYVAKQAITHLALKPNETVLDPGCGTGIFALTILRDLSKKSKDPASFGYIGIENDPILALSTAISLDWVNAPTKWQVRYANFLLIKSKDLPRIDAIIANPPFVRYHKLSERSELTNKPGLSMFSGLHSFFLDHSSELLRKGRMVFIVPMEMNRTRYGSKLLKQLRRKFTLTSKIIYPNKKKETWEVAELQDLTLEKHTQIRQAWSLMIFRPVSDSKARKKSTETPKSRKGAIVPLHSIASVHRGISTGANDFFVMADELVKEIGIPKKWRKKVIPTKIRKARLSDIFGKKDWNNLKEEGKPCWLLCLPQKTPTDDLPPGVRQYLRKGVREGVHLVPTCRNRRPWYYINLPACTPDLVFTYISRGYPKFICNEARVYNLTNLLGIYLKVPRARTRSLPDKIVDFTKLLNSELRKWIDQKSVGRRYKGGLVKFEPGDLKNMPISESAVDRLGIGFTSLDFHLNPSV